MFEKENKGIQWFETEYCSRCNMFEHGCNGENRATCIEAEKLRKMTEIVVALGIVGDDENII